jgi:DNA polymerase-3 subunit delta'
MPWEGIYGHDEIADRFQRSISRGRLASTFLFVGPPGVGKWSFARKLARALLCQARPQNSLTACGQCEDCIQVDALVHPDLILVAKPEDSAVIPLKTFIGDPEHRMQQGLCHDISLKPYRGGRKIAIIDDADLMNVEGANCLLKTLEEPPPHSILILIGTSEQKQLPTIRSRSQIIRFQRLPQPIVAQLLLERGMADDASEADRLAELSGGSLQRARVWSDVELRDFRRQVLDHLKAANPDTVGFARELASFVDRAGKLAPPRRERMRQVIHFATEFYRQVMRSLSGLEVVGDAHLVECVQHAVEGWPSGVEASASCLNRCLDALEQVDANANLPTLLECWLDDLAVLARGQSVTSAL